jgi:hypothetical protein
MNSALTREINDALDVLQRRRVINKDARFYLWQNYLARYDKQKKD